MNTSSPRLSDYALLTGLAIIFGSSFMFTSIAVQELSPVVLAWLRVFIALLILYPLMWMAGEHLPKSGRLWLFIVASALFGNAIPFWLIGWGQIKVEAGLTAIFMAIMPLTTIVLAQFFTQDEKLNRWKVCGVLFGLAGVIVLMGWDALRSIGDDTLRQLAILLAAVCYAINAIITKQLLSVPKKSMIAALMLSSVLLLLPWLLIEAPWSVRPSATAIGAVVMLAIGPTAIATLLILVIIDRQGASFLSQINFMVPVFGVLFGTVFLAERLSPNAYIALVLILVGVALSRWGNQREN
ncbi:MAG: DMT family transporter [Gammaproteobacteria bacterium]|nr:DMT family transporter [Gammaproteobacteria bacterium]